jgi:hypothetical protein
MSEEKMQWQPIETAPKDDTDVLVYYEVATVPIVHIAFWRPAYCIMDDCDKPENEGWWSYIQYSITQEKLEGYRAPTHWMPFNRPTQ